VNEVRSTIRYCVTEHCDSPVKIIELPTDTVAIVLPAQGNRPQIVVTIMPDGVMVATEIEGQEREHLTGCIFSDALKARAKEDAV
jgi:hypothetical protein